MQEIWCVVSSLERRKACASDTFLGKIISLKAMGQCLVIIDDVETAVNLLDKRSGIYSSRPQSAMVELYVIPISHAALG